MTINAYLDSKNLSPNTRFMEMLMKEYENCIKPFTDEVSKQLLEILISKKMGNKITEDQWKNTVNDYPTLKTLDDQLKKYQYFFTDFESRLLLGILSNYDIRTHIYLLTWIQYCCTKLNKFDVNVEFLAANVFPIGIPSQKDINHLWEIQRIKNRNALEMLEFIHTILK